MSALSHLMLGEAWTASNVHSDISNQLLVDPNVGRLKRSSHVPRSVRRLTTGGVTTCNVWLAAYDAMRSPIRTRSHS